MAKKLKKKTTKFHKPVVKISRLESQLKKLLKYKLQLMDNRSAMLKINNSYIVDSTTLGMYRKYIVPFIAQDADLIADYEFLMKGFSYTDLSYPFLTLISEYLEKLSFFLNEFQEVIFYKFVSDARTHLRDTYLNTTDETVTSISAVKGNLTEHRLNGVKQYTVVYANEKDVSEIYNTLYDNVESPEEILQDRENTDFEDFRKYINALMTANLYMEFKSYKLDRVVDTIVAQFKDVLP